MTLTLFMTLTSDKLNWCPGSQISIFHEMTLTLTQDLGKTLTSFMILTSDKSTQVKTEIQVAKLGFFIN